MEQKSIEKIICDSCGKNFYLQDAKNAIGRMFYINTYDEFFPEENICIDCAEKNLNELWPEFFR